MLCDSLMICSEKVLLLLKWKIGYKVLIHLLPYFTINQKNKLYNKISLFKPNEIKTYIKRYQKLKKSLIAYDSLL